MNIYVGNLSYEVTEEELRKAFEAFGHVDSTKIIMDMYTGRSKGFGFIEMPNRGEAQSAIEAMNGKDLRGRPIRVSKARSRSGARREGPGRQSGRRGGGWPSY